MAGTSFSADSYLLGNDAVGIYYTSATDPDVSGFDAPMGSLLLSPGKLWVKSDTSTTAWGSAGTTTTPSFTGINGFASTTINYTLSNKVLILADTTTNPIIVTLPTAASMLNRVFHIKWKKGLNKNRVTITCATNELIEGFDSQIMGEIGDNLEIVSIGTEWVII